MNTIQRPETKVNAPAESCNPLMRDKIFAMVAERGIKQGMLSLRIARQLYPKAKIGDEMDIAGAKFIVGK